MNRSLIAAIVGLVVVAGFAPVVFARITNPGGGGSSSSSGGGVATSSPWTSGYAAYVDSGGNLRSVATSSMAVGSTLSVASGAFGYQIGGSNVTFGLNLGNANSWTALQTFSNATATLMSSSYASSTAGFFGDLTVNGVPQFPSTIKLSAASIARSGAHLLTLTTTNTTNVTFPTSGTLAALGNENAWTALQTFANASTTLLSSASLYTNFIKATSTTATSTFSGGVSFAGTIQLSAAQPATTTAITLDWANTLPQVEYRIGTSATTITLINATTSTQWGSRKLVWVCNPNASAGALTWAGVEWIGTAPTQTTTANQCDVYSFDVTRATSSTAYKVAGTAGAGFQ